MKNYYKILQVSETASQEIIEKSYKTLVKKYHPDIAKDKKGAEEIMKDLNVAYDILSSPEKRKDYDNQLFAEREATRQKTQQQTYRNVKTNSYYDVKTNSYRSQTNYYNNQGTQNTRESPIYYKFINKIFNVDFEKLNHLDDNQTIIIIIIAIFIGTIMLMVSIYDLKKVTRSDYINTNNIVDEEPSKYDNKNDEEIIRIVANDFLNAFIEFDYVEMRNLTSNNLREKLVNDEVAETIRKRKDLYNYFVKNMSFSVVSIEFNGKYKANVTFKIDNIDILNMADLIYQIKFDANELPKNKIDKIYKEYDDVLQSKMYTFKAINENGIWKLDVNDYDITNMLGMSFNTIYRFINKVNDAEEKYYENRRNY